MKNNQNIRVLGQEGPILILIQNRRDCSDRYEKIAEKFNENKIRLLLFDLLGHGSRPVEGELGYYGKDKEIALIKDLKALVEQVKEDYPEEDLHFLALGFGTSLARVYLSLYPEDVKSTILVGPEGPNFFSKFIISLLDKLEEEQGEFHRSEHLNSILYDHYHEKIQDPVTIYDWISDDIAVVRDFVEHESCNFIPTVNGFQTEMTLSREANSETWYRDTEDLPLLFLQGLEDPMGDYGRGLSVIKTSLEKYGKEKAEVRLYENLRHDLLLGPGKEKVYEDIIKWIKDH